MSETEQKGNNGKDAGYSVDVKDPGVRDVPDCGGGGKYAFSPIKDAGKKTNVEGLRYQDHPSGKDESVERIGLQGGARNPITGSRPKAPLKGGTPATFGEGDTVALLVAGAGVGYEIFKKDVEKMKTLLTSERVGINEDMIHSVFQRPTSKTCTKTYIKEAITKIKEELKDSKNGYFIFFYSGHFDKDHTFLVDNKGNKMSDDYFDEEFAQDMLQIPAKYVLFILDMCYAASANVYAKTKGKDDVGHVAPMPRLWEFFTNQSKSRRKGLEKTGCSAEKVVQWASSLNHEESMYGDNCSYFTKAIIDVITHSEVGSALRQERPDEMTHATVLQLNRHVGKQLKTMVKGQTPDIKPPHADESYFEEYPLLAKVKLLHMTA